MSLPSHKSMVRIARIAYAKDRINGFTRSSINPHCGVAGCTAMPTSLYILHGGRVGQFSLSCDAHDPPIYAVLTEVVPERAVGPWRGVCPPIGVDFQ